MFNAGLSSPFPVTLSPVRRGSLTVGKILLAEHVGSTRSVRTFLATHFGKMDEKERSDFLKRLVAFWKGLDTCGFFGLSFRYLHVGRACSRGSEAPLYLFDLDKVWVGRPKRGVLHRLRARSDDRRFVSGLVHHVTPEEMDMCVRLLRHGQVG
jgi:hypothetical protein